MCIKQSKQARSQAYTLMEVMVAMGLFALLAVPLASLYLYATTSFAAMANYAELDKINRTAMDTMSKEIRLAQAITDYATNSTTTSVTMINGDGIQVTYTFNALSGKLIRSDARGDSKVLLTDCKLLDFQLYQRNPINATYDIYPAATNNWAQTVKVISMTWKASRTMPFGNSVSENIQTARVVLRRQKQSS